MSYYSDAFLAGLEANGVKVAESERFYGVVYKPDKYGINIYAGKCGQLQINWDSLDDFFEELKQFKEAYCG